MPSRAANHHTIGMGSLTLVEVFHAVLLGMSVSRSCAASLPYIVHFSLVWRNKMLILIEYPSLGSYSGSMLY